MVLLATLDFSENKSPASWVNLPRFHHQFMPDVVEYEQGALTAVELAGLAAKGHKTQVIANSYGDMQATLWHKTTHVLEAASDKRGEGLATIK
jgi:gamma-glutamyltranspeptidase/glutathione hydrolase